MCLQSFPSPIMSSALRPIYSQGDISECIFNNHPLVMREGMYVSVMCSSWTCLLAMRARSVSPSLRPVIVFHLAWLHFLCKWKTFVANPKSRSQQKERRRKGWGENRKRGASGCWGGRGAVFFFFFFPSPRALLFQKCLGLHSSTSTPLGLSTAS